jgi:hypothetical protein
VPQQSDREYYAARAAAERELEASAKDQAIAGIHGQLALRYERLAASDDGTLLHTLPFGSTPQRTAARLEH